MYQNTFCNRAVPGPAGEAYALPQASRNGIILLRGGIEEEGPAYRGREGRREGTKREGKGIPPQSQGEYNKHWMKSITINMHDI